MREWREYLEASSKKHFWLGHPALAKAMAEFKETGTFERTISKKNNNIPRTTFQRSLQENLDKVGQKPVFMEGKEADLKYCIQVIYFCILATYFNINFICH